MVDPGINADELEALRGELAKIWTVFKPSIISSFDIRKTPRYAIHLHDVLIKLETLDEEIARTKQFKVLKQNLKEFISTNGALPNFKKWNITVYENLSYLIKKLKIYEEFNKEKIWGTFKFSEIFPETFKWFQSYVPLRRPEYLGKTIPDLNVKVKSSNLHRHVMAAVRRGSFAGATYLRMRGMLLVDLTILPLSFLPRSISDVKRLLRYMDHQQRYKQLLIHEYEHHLQQPFRFKFNLGNFFSTRLRKGIGFNYGVWYLNTFMSIYGLPVRLLLSKFLQKWDYLLKLAFYDYKRDELEARLAQFVFLIAYDRPEADVIGSENIHRKFLGKVEGDREIYLAGLHEQSQLLQQLRATNINAAEVKQVENNIQNLKRRLWALEQFSRDYTFLLTEARKYGTMLREKRQTIIQQVEGTNVP